MAVRSRRIWFCTLYETQHVEANDAKLVEHAGVDNSFSSILSLTLSDEHYLSDLEESVYYTFHLFCLFFFKLLSSALFISAKTLARNEQEIYI